MAGASGRTTSRPRPVNGRVAHVRIPNASSSTVSASQRAACALRSVRAATATTWSSTRSSGNRRGPAFSLGIPVPSPVILRARQMMKTTVRRPVASSWSAKGATAASRAASKNTVIATKLELTAQSYASAMGAATRTGVSSGRLAT